MQRGLRAGIPERGRFLAGAEHLVGHFQKLVVGAVLGDDTALNAAVARRAAEVARSVPVEPTGSAPTEQDRSRYIELEVFRIEPESEIITSFYLRRADGEPLSPWQPGQFLPIRVTVPGQEQPALRTYTLSAAANPDHYRLSIRRGEGKALVSQFLHANARPGLRIEAMAPRGKFVLTRSAERAVVLISAGVGITPMIAMAEHIVAEGQRTGVFRPVHFIHCAQNSKVHAFRRHVHQLAAAHPAFRVHVRYSHAGTDDVLGETHHSTGQIDMALLRQILPFGDHEFYLCGPPGFMRSLYDGLTGIGVPVERIFYESFGPATVLKPEARQAALPVGEGSVPVRFIRSDAGAAWSRERGTLLELAESIGLAPAFGCRSGICGTCTTRIIAGAVDYLEEPVAPRGPGEVLLCCSVPRSGADVVLDL